MSDAEPSVQNEEQTNAEEDISQEAAEEPVASSMSHTGPDAVGSGSGGEATGPTTDAAPDASAGGPGQSETVNSAGDTRNLRRIIAEDPEWNLATVPLLSSLCITHFIDNFAFNSTMLRHLNPRQHEEVLSRTATDLPLKVTGPLIRNEAYWSRVCRGRWRLCDVSQYSGSWKRMFFERNLEEIIELYVPEKTDPTRLLETLDLSAPYIQKLNVRQLLPPMKEETKEDDSSDVESDAGEPVIQEHFDFTRVLPQLHNLVEFRVSYGVRDCGMNFEWNLFQFTSKDCLALAKCVAAATQLKVFQLHRSRVDCDKCRVIISHLLDHPALVELDLSHNSIGDRGARALGKFLNGHSQLRRLDVCNNQIRAAGAQAIAHALTKNTTLTELNLRLNRLADDGGQAICKALLRNDTLASVNLAANDMTEPTAAILSQVVSQNTTLTSLDLSNNRLGPDGGKQLQEGMEENATLTQLDLRFTECGQEAEFCVCQIIEKNQERRRQEEASASIGSRRSSQMARA